MHNHSHTPARERRSTWKLSARRDAPEIIARRVCIRGDYFRKSGESGPSRCRGEYNEREIDGQEDRRMLLFLFQNISSENVAELESYRDRFKRGRGKWRKKERKRGEIKIGRLRNNVVMFAWIVRRGREIFIIGVARCLRERWSDGLFIVDRSLIDLIAYFVFTT